MGNDNPATKRSKFCIQILFVGFIFGVLSTTDSTFVFLPFPNYRPPPACPPNEVYKSCVNNCSNCDQRGICPTTECGNSGCDCINRFVRVTPGGPCEPIYKCPVPECGENEVYRECGPICERCGTLQCRVMGCDHKCYCKEGYLRDWGGNCVPEDECIILHCPRDTEELKETGPEDDYCVHPEGVAVSNATQDKEQCYCKEGFKRSYIGHCVPERNCPTRCMGIEQYLPCPKKCNTTCRNYGDPTCVEDGQCYPGCFCPEGYIMNDFRFCILPDHCPPGSNPFAPTVPPTIPVELTASPTSDTDTETNAPEEPGLEETAPEEPGMEETAPEEPALEEMSPGESSLEETVPEETNLEEATADAPTSEADAVDRETTEEARIDEDYKSEDEDVPPEEDDQTTAAAESEETTETESTEIPAPTAKPKSTKRAKASAEERLQKTEHTPTSKNTKSRKVIDSASDVDDAEE